MMAAASIGFPLGRDLVYKTASRRNDFMILRSIAIAVKLSEKK